MMVYRLLISASITIIISGVSTADPVNTFYDNVDNVHPGYTIHNIGTQSNSDINNSSTVFDEALDQCPQVMGLDFLSDGRLAVVTQDAVGSRNLSEDLSDRMNSRLYIYSNDVQGNDMMDVMGEQISGVLLETSGLVVVNDTIFLAQRDRLVYTDWKEGSPIVEQDDLVKIGDVPVTTGLIDGGGNPMSFQEYPLGLLYREGKFYIPNSAAMPKGGAGGPPVQDDFYSDFSGVGSIMSIDRNGNHDVITTGLRAQDGIGWGPGEGPDGEFWEEGGIWTTDNQGHWKPCSPLIHAKRGEWHYYPRPSTDYPNNTEGADAAVWMPHGDISRSPTEPAHMKTGIFKGQLFLGDVSQGGLKRCFLEKVNGNWQGSAHSFSGGFSAGPNRLRIGPEGELYVGHIGRGDAQNWGWRGTKCGLQKLIPNGTIVFEILAVRSRNNGMELEFTLPVDQDGAETADNYLVRRYEMQPNTDYGGGHKVSNTAVPVTGVTLSEDRKRVFLEMDFAASVYRNGSLQRHTVIDIRLRNNNGETEITSGGNSARTPAAWYTLNSISASEAFDINGCTDPGFNEYDENATFDDGTCGTPVGIIHQNGPAPFGSISSESGLTVSLKETGIHQVEIRKVTGELAASRTGTGRKTYSFPDLRSSAIYIVRIATKNNTFNRKIFLH